MLSPPSYNSFIRLALILMLQMLCSCGTFELQIWWQIMVSWPQWRWLEGRTDVGNANGCRLLPSHLWVHALGIHIASQIDLLCSLFELHPSRQLPREAAIRWGTSIKPVESLLLASDWIHKLVFHSRLVQRIDKLLLNSWIWEEMSQRDWGVQIWIELWYVFSPTSINNFRRKFTEPWKGPTRCWIRTSVSGFSHLKNYTDIREHRTRDPFYLRA